MRHINDHRPLYASYVYFFLRFSDTIIRLSVHSVLLRGNAQLGGKPRCISQFFDEFLVKSCVKSHEYKKTTNGGTGQGNDPQELHAKSNPDSEERVIIVSMGLFNPVDAELDGELVTDDVPLCLRAGRVADHGHDSAVLVLMGHDVHGGVDIEMTRLQMTSEVQGEWYGGILWIGRVRNTA